ncbi:hypothetical protein [Streptomyces albipurpureus]|uniref:Uncharacterized protein n=1 Tax=Streptomyces albipurpureus TaxID=2897419 RepID=A0ABT0UWX1_9ACTN|nr:hypothetical protein [Streptomyces sp. CWNU-1]MCM2392736.1 hypothetical protein [Streptomyces sp. CWNU-1]
MHGWNNPLPPVAQSLKPGCHFTEPSADGVIERYKLRGTVFKGRRPTGDEDTWVVIEPVAQAVVVLENLTRPAVLPARLPP